jgi:hypothetical protein
MRKGLAGWVADRRMTTKIVASSAVILMLTVVVGATGIAFVEVLQSRMQRAAASTATMTALQGIVADVELYRSARDPALADRIAPAIATQAAAIAAAKDGAADGAASLVTASTALGTLGTDFAAAVALNADLAVQSEALRSAATAVSTASGKLGETALLLDRDLGRRSGAVKDAIKAAARVTGALTETETALADLSARFDGAPDAQADAAALAKASTVTGKAIRKLRAAVPKEAQQALKDFEGAMNELKASAELAASTPEARILFAPYVSGLGERTGTLRQAALAMVATATEQLTAIDAEAVMVKGIFDGAQKFEAASRGLQLDVVEFLSSRDARGAESLEARLAGLRTLS